ncbi:hypothetical protein LguiB_026359 [Lonicera macranthoides]
MKPFTKQLLRKKSEHETLHKAASKKKGQNKNSKLLTHLMDSDSWGFRKKHPTFTKSP